MKLANPQELSCALRWALEEHADPSMSAADWLAADISPEHASAVDMLADPNVPLNRLRQAKDVFKTMRVLGETSADRRLGARLYAASIAAALAFHDERISTQSNGALRNALDNLHEDTSVPDPLREVAGMALCLLPRD